MGIVPTRAVMSDLRKSRLNLIVVVESSNLIILMSDVVKI